MTDTFRHPHRLPSGGSVIYWLAIATAILMTLAWTSAWGILPSDSDDLMMQYPFRYGYDGAADAILHEYLNRYNDDVGRLSNLGYMLTIPGGRWCGAIIGGICLLASVWLMARLSGAGRNAPATLAFGVCAYLLILPWHDGMTKQAFGYNYIVSTALLTAVLLLFMRGGGRSAASRCATVLLALLLGAWHEGFSVPLLCGCLVWCVANRHEAGATRWLVCVALAIGIIWLFTAPGLHNRMGADGNFAWQSIFSVETNRKFILTWAYWITLAICTIRHRADAGRSSIHIIIATACAATFSIYVSHPSYLRAVWPGETLALTGLMSLAAHTRAGRRLRFAARAATAALCVASWSHLYAFTGATVRQASEHREMLRRYLASPDGTVWLDFTPDYMSDPLALKRAANTDYSAGLFSGSYTTYYTKGRKPLRVVPLALRGADSLPGRLIDGNAGVRYHCGYYYMEAGRYDSLGHPYALIFSLDNGRSSSFNHNSVPFTTPAGGRFVWIHPTGAYSFLHGATPVRIDLP